MRFRMRQFQRILGKNWWPRKKRAVVGEPAWPGGKRRSGLTLMEILLSLAIIGMVTVSTSQSIVESVSVRKDQVTAEHFRKVRDATALYIRDNFSAVQTAAAAGPISILPTTVQGAGYIDPNVSFTNPYGQSYGIVVRQTGASTLEAVVLTTGGTAFGDASAGIKSGPRIASMAGADGGYIPYTAAQGDPGACLVDPCARGAYNGWTVALAPFAPTGVTTTAGHLAGAVFFDSGTIVEPYLYRSAVAGAPEANAMSTSIDMNTNDINNVDDIWFDTKQVFASNAPHHIYLVGDGAVITKPTCPTGAANIYTFPSMMSDNGTGYTMSAVQTWAEDNGATWTVRMRVRTEEGWIGGPGAFAAADSSYIKAVAMMNCS